MKASSASSRLSLGPASIRSRSCIAHPRRHRPCPHQCSDLPPYPVVPRAAHPREHHARVSPSGPACRPGPRPSAEPDQARRESLVVVGTWPVAIPTRRRDKDGPLRAEGRNPARRADGLRTDQPHGQDHPAATLGADGAHPRHGTPRRRSRCVGWRTRSAAGFGCTGGTCPARPISSSRGSGRPSWSTAASGTGTRTPGAGMPCSRRHGRSGGGPSCWPTPRATPGTWSACPQWDGAERRAGSGATGESGIRRHGRLGIVTGLVVGGAGPA